MSGMPQPSLPAALLPPAAVACEWTFSEAPTVSTFFPVPGEPTVFGPRAGVAGREDDHHLLVARGGHGGARGLGVADERVVAL